MRSLLLDEVQNIHGGGTCAVIGACIGAVGLGGIGLALGVSNNALVAQGTVGSILGATGSAVFMTGLGIAGGFFLGVSLGTMIDGVIAFSHFKPANR